MSLSLKKFPPKTKFSSKNENIFFGSTRKGTKYDNGRTTGLTGVRNAQAKGKRIGRPSLMNGDLIKKICLGT